MKINIIGGGPAGLYFAILMKKQDPAREVALFERNAPDDTFGWGVVFSDKTLSYLKDNDEETHDQIVKSFETWDNVDVVHRDQKITIRGNRFSGIARIELLGILQRRCLQLGIPLNFRAEVSDIDALKDCDLLVGADGINSATRARYSEHFRPELGTGNNRYIWYGTRQLFHGLTLTFRETERGVFAAHSYKFNKEMSTFIIECDKDTWDASGFEGMTEEATRGLLAELFSKDLHGHELLSNNSKWIRFINVKNRNWSHENVVLLGDALHTAHFSIGSGTKLALEDSIALSKCFAAAGEVAPALEEFERVRKPVIEEYQEAAIESMLWFENVKDYMSLSPVPFAYRLMTRSKRIDYENLKKRDPQFIAAYEQSGS